MSLFRRSKNEGQKVPEPQISSERASEILAALTFEDRHVLRALQDQYRTDVEIAAHVGLSISTSQESLDRLEGFGLLQRGYTLDDHKVGDLLDRIAADAQSEIERLDRAT